LLLVGMSPKFRISTSQVSLRAPYYPQSSMFSIIQT
jgi:hypothetical protein